MNAADLTALWSSWGGSSSSFREELGRRGVQYLSWTRVSTYLRCPACYYRQYVLKESIETEAVRFGALFHEIAQQAYSGSESSGASAWFASEAFQLLSEPGQQELRNACQMLGEAMWDKAQVIAVEEPMFLDISPGLPPVYGIADLLIREHEDKVIIVDHKTTKSFVDRGSEQLALYAEMVRRQYGVEHVEGCFDEYRRVANLARIRTPAFRRVMVPTPRKQFLKIATQWKDAWPAMQELHQADSPYGTDGCWECIRYNRLQSDAQSVSAKASRAPEETGVLRTRPADESEMALFALDLGNPRTSDLLARGFRTVADVAEAATGETAVLRVGTKMLSPERKRLRKLLEKRRAIWSQAPLPRITIPATLRARPVSSLGLLPRFERALAAFGCKEFADLHGSSEYDLCRVYGIGGRAFNDVVEKLDEIVSAI